MSGRPDKQRRKELLWKVKSDQRAAARAALPLSDDLMRALFDMLDVKLPRQGCDRSLRLVREWLGDRQLQVEPVEAWLRENGGSCDCEALANAEERWKDAIADVP